MQQFLHLSSLVIFTWMQVLITDYWKSIEKWWISFVLIVPCWNGTKKGVLFWQEKNLSISSSVLQSSRNVACGTYSSSFLNFYTWKQLSTPETSWQRKATKLSTMHLRPKKNLFQAIPAPFLPPPKKIPEGFFPLRLYIEEMESPEYCCNQRKSHQTPTTGRKAFPNTLG